MRYITNALVIVVLAAILIFAIQNLDAVDVRFLNLSISMSKVFVILGTYFLGMLSGWRLVELFKLYFKNKR